MRFEDKADAVSDFRLRGFFASNIHHDAQVFIEIDQCENVGPFRAERAARRAMNDRDAVYRAAALRGLPCKRAMLA